MTGAALAWLLAVLIAVSAAVFAVVAWDMRRLPRLIAEQRVVAAAVIALCRAAAPNTDEGEQT